MQRRVNFSGIGLRLPFIPACSCSFIAKRSRANHSLSSSRSERRGMAPTPSRFQARISFLQLPPWRKRLPLPLYYVINFARGDGPNSSSIKRALRTQQPKRHWPVMRDNGPSIHVSKSADRIVDWCCHCRVNQRQVQAGLVPRHSDFDWLHAGHNSSGNWRGSTRSSMLRATPGCLLMNPARSSVSTIW